MAQDLLYITQHPELANVVSIKKQAKILGGGGTSPNIQSSPMLLRSKKEKKGGGCTSSKVKYRSDSKSNF